jgi:hypothetical protein
MPDERDELLEAIEKESKADADADARREVAETALAEIRRVMRVARVRGLLKYPEP